MESKKLAALISSLISQLLLLLLSLPSNSDVPFNPTNPNQNPYSNSSLFSLVNLLTSHELATSLSISQFSRKRKRTLFPDTDLDSIHEPRSIELGPRLSELARVVRGPDSFRTFFKMRSSTFEWLSGLLEPLLDCRDPVGSPLNLSAELRLGIGLFRLATGSGYQEIATRFGVTESVSRFCAKQLCRVLCTNFRFWVGFPSPNELELVSRDFEAISGLPNCCGVINCMRFSIERKDDPNLVDSIGVQTVVDSSSKILSIIAGFRGEKSDSSILKSTTLFQDIEGGRLLNSGPVIVNGVALNQYLIGDRGYPLLPWLMVPFADAAPRSREERFNNVAKDLIHMRGVRAIASLKNWGVLSRTMQEEFRIAVGFVGACAILHNALLMREDDSALLDLESCTSWDRDSERSEDSVVDENLMELSKGFDARRALAMKLMEV